MVKIVSSTLLLVIVMQVYSFTAANLRQKRKDDSLPSLGKIPLVDQVKVIAELADVNKKYETQMGDIDKSKKTLEQKQAAKSALKIKFGLISLCIMGKFNELTALDEDCSKINEATTPAST